MRKLLVVILVTMFSAALFWWVGHPTETTKQDTSGKKDVRNDGQHVTEKKNQVVTAQPEDVCIHLPPGATIGKAHKDINWSKVAWRGDTYSVFVADSKISSDLASDLFSKSIHIIVAEILSRSTNLTREDIKISENPAIKSAEILVSSQGNSSLVKLSYGLFDDGEMVFNHENIIQHKKVSDCPKCHSTDITKQDTKSKDTQVEAQEDKKKVASKDQALLKAVKDGNLEAVKKLLLAGANVNAKGWIDNTPLHSAASRGHKEVAALLIAKGADVNAEDVNGGTPLDSAATQGQIDIAEFLIANEVDVNGRNSNGKTPLQRLYHYEDMVAFLITKGADVNAKDKEGATTLFAAIRWGEIEVAELLIRNGADVNVRKNDGETLLHLAVRKKSKKIVELLIAKGCDVDIDDARGRTPLDVAASDFVPSEEIKQILLKNKALTGKELKEMRALLATMDPKDRALLKAAEDGDLEAVKRLLSEGADVHARDEHKGVGGDRPLHKTARKGHVKIAKLLIDQGANIEAKNIFGGAPLHYAAQYGHKEVVELLLSKGANISVRNKGGVTPLRRSGRGGHTEIAKLLIAQGADINVLDDSRGTPLHAASRFGHKEVAAFFIAQGIDVNVRNKTIWTPLHFAAKYGRREMVEWLISQGADVNIKTVDGWSPLLAAVINKHADVAQLLVEKGANINSQANDGTTPLFIVALNGDKNIVNLLISKGANVNVKVNQGWAPLHAAAEKGDKEIAMMLISGGAKINAKHKDGLTPLYLAAGKGHKELAELFLAAGAEITEEARAYLIQLRIDIKPKKGDVAPPISFTFLDGTNDSLANHRGQIVIVDFWATWCGPCIDSMPHMQGIWTKYKHDGVYLVGISKESSEKVSTFLRDKQNLTYPIAISADASMAYGVGSIPHVYLVDPSGIVWWHGHPARMDQPLKELREKFSGQTDLVKEPSKRVKEHATTKEYQSSANMAYYIYLLGGVAFVFGVIWILRRKAGSY